MFLNIIPITTLLTPNNTTIYIYSIFRPQGRPTTLSLIATLSMMKKENLADARRPSLIPTSWGPSSNLLHFLVHIPASQAGQHALQCNSLYARCYPSTHVRTSHASTFTLHLAKLDATYPHFMGPLFHATAWPLHAPRSSSVPPIPTPSSWGP